MDTLKKVMEINTQTRQDTDKNKPVLKKYKELWDEIKNQGKTINGGEPIEYKKDFIKKQF